MASIAEIEQEVFSDLKTLAPRGTKISRDQRLMVDLKLMSDDATTLALDMERKFKVKIPRLKWEAVSTVQDVIDLLATHTGTT
jgi:acyl carrier protein